MCMFSPHSPVYVPVGLRLCCSAECQTVLEPLPQSPLYPATPPCAADLPPVIHTNKHTRLESRFNKSLWQEASMDHVTKFLITTDMISLFDYSKQTENSFQFSNLMFLDISSRKYTMHLLITTLKNVNICLLGSSACFSPLLLVI